MNKKQVLKKVAAQVRYRLDKEGTGHDWYHIERVVKAARHIGIREKADLFIVELAALLHELGDWKFHDGDDTQTVKIPKEILMEHGIDRTTAHHVCEIIMYMSYRGGQNPPLKTIEGKVVQDADRLDSLGALGIARVFAYGGKKGRPLHDPHLKPKKSFKSKAEYFHHKNTSINHFYEKLLLLKDKMNTKTGKRLAAPRHQFLKTYLKQFYVEWQGSGLTTR